MKLLFKQRFFSWFDSYDIYNESGETMYVVKGQLSWGHCLKIFDAHGNEVGTVKERILTWLPKFEMYMKNQYIGCISKEFTLFIPRFNIDCKGWRVDGSLFEWDYCILDRYGTNVATISKEVLKKSAAKVSSLLLKKEKKKLLKLIAISVIPYIPLFSMCLEKNLA